MSREEWKQYQAKYPELKDVSYEDAKWGQYKYFLDQKMPGITKTIGEATTPADRYSWDLTGRIAEAGGVSRRAGGGRVPFKLGGIDKGRRAFMKWFAGITGATVAAGTGLIKWGKIAGKGKTVIKAGDTIIQGTEGMPSWFIPLVNRITKEGTDVSKKLSTIEREIVHTAKIDKVTDVTVYQDLNTGNVRVSIESPHNMGEAPVDLMYTAPIEDIVTKGGKTKAVKTKSEFEAAESEPRWEGNPEDPDLTFDGENVVGKVEDLTSDTTAVESFATKKKPTLKKIVKSQKAKKTVRSINEDVTNQADYLEGKYGPGPEPDVGMDEFGNLVDEYGKIID